ncbi:MAG: hypothetical protein ACYC3W_02335 [Candidatus Nanopelagicales bacterium]
MNTASTSPESIVVHAKARRELVQIIEWIGAFLGMAGALALSWNVSWSKWGWVGFLASNLFLIALAIHKRMWGFLMMQLVFTYTSINGIVHYF